ncbi:MAG: hypothetical protein MJB14_05955 [Spirochaetes bacterium]|nr:hypothetical protein [Spirochaetota bacterium]
MQKAMFFEEAFKKGILSKVDGGYIFSLTTPEADMDHQLDPFLIEMISYSGVKSIVDMGNAVKFQAQGMKMYCMLEPAAYTEKHIEPTYRSQNSTGHMPFRFNDCKTFLTKDNKLNILVPQKPYNCYDSFTVSFPGKGDLCILYFLFDKDLQGKVLPYIEENIQVVIGKTLGLRKIDVKKIAAEFMTIVKKFDIRTNQ